MNDLESQVSLFLTIENSKDVIELIKHKDHHYWVYFNGQKTDAMIPRSSNFNENDNPYEIFKELWYGKSKFNERRITNFFKDLNPEEFL